MVKISDVVNERITELKKQGYTIKKNDIAKSTGYSAAYITDLINGDGRWNEEVIEKVFEVLCIEIQFKNKPYRKVG